MRNENDEGKYLKDPFASEAKLPISDLVFKDINKNNGTIPTFRRTYTIIL